MQSQYTTNFTPWTHTHTQPFHHHHQSHLTHKQILILPLSSLMKSLVQVNSTFCLCTYLTNDNKKLHSSIPFILFSLSPFDFFIINTDPQTMKAKGQIYLPSAGIRLKLLTQHPHHWAILPWPQSPSQNPGETFKLHTGTWWTQRHSLWETNTFISGTKQM